MTSWTDRALPPTEQLLLSALSPQPDLPRLRNLAEQNPDWPRLLQLAAQNAVTPLAVKALGPLMPEPYRQQARLQALAMAGDCLVLTAELKRIHRAFAQTDLDLVAYKGPALSCLLHGNSVSRPCGDLDLVVPPAQVPQARELLLTLGYRPQWPRADIRAFLRFHYEYRLTHRDKAITVELKWDFCPKRWIGYPERSGWPARLERQDVSGVSMLALSPEDLFLILAIHGAKHRWSQLKWVCDMAYLVHRSPHLDWAAVRQRARGWGAVQAYRLGLLLAARLGSEPPGWSEAAGDPQLARLADDVFAALLGLRSPLGRAFDAQLRRGVLSKMEYVLRTLFDPTVDDLVCVTLPPRLHPLYYLVRPCQVVWSRLFGRPVAPQSDSSV